MTGVALALLLLLAAAVAMRAGVLLGRHLEASDRPATAVDDVHTAPERGMVPYHAIAALLLAEILTPERLYEEIVDAIPEVVEVGPVRRALVAQATGSARVHTIEVERDLSRPPLVAFTIRLVMEVEVAVQAVGLDLAYRGEVALTLDARAHVREPLVLVVAIDLPPLNDVMVHLEPHTLRSAVVRGLAPVERITAAVVRDTVRDIAWRPPLSEVRVVPLGPLLDTGWDARRAALHADAACGPHDEAVGVPR